LDGLYTEDEMNSENVKDREGKIRYLEKVLDCLSFALGGQPLSAKPSKIVSGQEAAKTNEFLQVK
jgi:TRAF3-interacting protein 1